MKINFWKRSESDKEFLVEVPTEEMVIIFQAFGGRIAGISNRYFLIKISESGFVKAIERIKITNKEKNDTDREHQPLT